jgi:hypothetical protein
MICCQQSVTEHAHHGCHLMLDTMSYILYNELEQVFGTVIHLLYMTYSSSSSKIFTPHSASRIEEQGRCHNELRIE